MAYTFLDLKREIRRIVWPAGESRNQFVPHNKSFVDVLVDLLTWVECLQIDNTQLIPHCATLYNCGLTVFDAPRGRINRLSVIDKVNEDGESDPEGEDDYCTEIPYEQVDFCHIQRYLGKSNTAGCCYNIPLFFSFPLALCSKGNVPVPTDEGLPAGLPTLPLGHSYPQESTDADTRSRCGVWAMEQGKIYVAPWINSTETIVVRWDGIKRDWLDGDLVDDDPKLKRAVEMYVRMDHARKFGKDKAAADDWERQYNVALSDLIHECRQENLQRDCRASVARGSRSTYLFYNDAQQYTASCPTDQVGDDVTFTVPADTVGSVISKSDANQKAQEQARAQAEAMLDCETAPVTYYNTPQTHTAECTVTEGSPIPDGVPVTVTVPAGAYTSTVSQAAADALALAAAVEQATNGLACTYWNSEQSYTAECPEGFGGTPVTKVIPEHTFSSSVSQAQADAEALNEAKVQAEEELEATEGCAELFYNTQQVYSKTANCPQCGPGLNLTMRVTVAAGYVSSLISQGDANTQAYNMARALGDAAWTVRCIQQSCGAHFLNIPPTT